MTIKPRAMRCTMELILPLIFIHVITFRFALSTKKGKKKKVQVGPIRVSGLQWKKVCQFRNLCL